VNRILLPKTTTMIPVVAAISMPVDITVGSAITNARPITGAWEQRLALGQAVGFDIEISTEAEGAPKSLTGVAQRVVYIWIKTYVRTNGRSERTFWSSGFGASAQLQWKSNRLVLHQPTADARPVELDLVFDPHTETWRGTLQNRWFSGSVVLSRPYVPHTGFPIIGDWMAGNSASGSFACHHVALGADSALVIWSDYVSLPGFTIYDNGTSPPSSTPEWYGDLDMDAEMKYIGSNMLFFTGSDMSGDIVLGSVAADDLTFVGSSAHFGNGPTNGAFNPLTWHRSTPDCARNM